MSRYQTNPGRYRHWKLSVDGEVARLVMAVREDEPFRPGYALKLNSYDLGVDIELCDAVQRLRFEHPEVRAVVLTAERDRVFSAGANIHMLATSTHSFKVNFCKYTNETRLSIEDASRGSGQKYVAALNGITAGGGYELALACDEIVLVDDGNSAVSLPEVPLLGVLPGTGGLTRMVDKRHVRRDLADVFATLAEGVKGPRAVQWRLVDEVVPKSRFGDAVAKRAGRLAAGVSLPKGPGVRLDPIAPERQGDTLHYRHVDLVVDGAKRTAALTVRGPEAAQPETAEAMLEAGSDLWVLRAFRELDDALLHLRFEMENVALVTLYTRGSADAVLLADRALWTNRHDWFANEVLLHMARTLRRLDGTARSFFAIADRESCFSGSLLELALAADRTYMLADAAGRVRVRAGELNGGALPMEHGFSRLALRHLGEPARADEALHLAEAEPLSAKAAFEAGLCTVVADEIDFAGEVRVAIEERASLSPDALTGLEQNLRFAGPETWPAKVFGRLSAWQNWIFTRPNATGERGALTLYGKPERPQFDWRRT
jgi:benzoyl-CoA-dihydrodiol lyase